MYRKIISITKVQKEEVIQVSKVWYDCTNSLRSFNVSSKIYGKQNSVKFCKQLISFV